MFSRSTRSTHWILPAILSVILGGCLPVEDPTTPTAMPTLLAIQPTPTQTPKPTDSPTTTPSFDNELYLTIVYDNYSYNPSLQTNWGFAAQVEYRDQIILFDTGGDWPTLRSNMEAMEIDPMAIQAVVISHVHGDHTGGLEGLLSVKPGLPVYVPPSIEAGMQAQYPAAVVKGTERGDQIADDIFSTGEIFHGLGEQALIIQMDKGLVVVTGCAHPGVDQLVGRAVELFGGPVELVIGGYHLGDASPLKIQRVINNLKEHGVKRVAPSHCTGDQAIQDFHSAFGEDFIQVGVGKVITMPSETGDTE